MGIAFFGNNQLIDQHINVRPHHLFASNQVLDSALTRVQAAWLMVRLAEVRIGRDGRNWFGRYDLGWVTAFA